ncbi:hypothetical protein [Actinophytocola sp.]|nr:hypothetical protein [Actinophytocola sp.]HET9144101.1 hypothetical protein [Actinophytocola sp.]
MEPKKKAPKKKVRTKALPTCPNHHKAEKVGGRLRCRVSWCAFNRWK